MSGVRLKYLFAFIYLLTFLPEIFGQNTRIHGRIRDAETGDPIPYANIYIQKSSVATMADDSGYYLLETKIKRDSIIASFLGYKALSKKYIRNTSQQINFNLYRNITNLYEIVIVPSENPAHRIFRNIIKRKKINNQRAQNYQCNVYNKVMVSLSNIDDQFRNKKILKPFKFIFENVDTNKLTGKTYLPILMSETTSKYYYQQNPEFEKSVVTATQISGVDNESVNQFVAGLNYRLDIYSNFMVFYSETGFVSPISDAGLLFYRYYLLDSAIRNGHKCYLISYKPRRKQERTFTGDFWVTDTSFAIQSITMQINPEANLNFISGLSAEYEFNPLNDSVWVLSKEHVRADLNLVEWKKINGLLGDKTTIYTNYILDKPISDSIKIGKEKTNTAGSTAHSGFWDCNRPEQLTQKEKQVYLMVDSVKNVPAFRTIYDLMSTLFGAYYSFGKFMLGPYFSVYSYNKVEGHRFKLGGTTTAKLSDTYKLTSYIAYGTYDKKLKYYGELIWIFRSSPRISNETVFKHDVSQINVLPDESYYENVISSFVRRRPLTKLQMIDNFNSTFETDLFSSVTNLSSFNYMRVFPSPFIPLINAHDGSSLPYISTSQVGVGFHLEKGQKFYQSKFIRGRIRNNHPAFEFSALYSLKGILGCKYKYWNFKFSMYQYLQTNPIGFNRYKIEAGKIIGKAPWPLLNVMDGNETYGRIKDAYNMMNYYEFVADEYVAFTSEQHLQGLILNYIPLMRRLKLREVLSIKAVAGRLNKRNTEDVTLPATMQSLNKPYIETGLGIENILKFIRIEGFWRLTHLNSPEVQVFQIKATLQFML